MAVFTQVSEAEAGKLLKALQLGSLHALRGIVHHHRQLIGPKAIGTQQHKVAHLLRQLLAVVAHHRIVKANILCRHAHPPSGRF